MANTEIGKAFEEKFKSCWKTTFPEGWIFRLKDQMNGYKESSENPCDFLCYNDGRLFMIECKAHKGASIPFTAIPQYERLLDHKNYKGVYPGVTIWFYEKDIVIWVGINEMEKMVADGEKSIGLRMLEKKLYNIIVVPGEKLRKFMQSDYSFLMEL